VRTGATRFIGLKDDKTNSSILSAAFFLLLVKWLAPVDRDVDRTTWTHDESKLGDFLHANNSMTPVSIYNQIFLASTPEDKDRFDSPAV
jgi:hypothetical protein